MPAATQFAPLPIPASAGIGLRPPHYQDIASRRPAIGWLEAHSENYFGAGGAPLAYLRELRALYPLSLHGVGLSLGSADPLNQAHLRQLKALVAAFEPALVSEHLSWSSVDGNYYNDLLPLPYTEQTLTHLAARVAHTQDFLQRQILVENPSNYLAFEESLIGEAQFLAELVQRSGCGLLLDINNVYVSARNLELDANAYLDAVPAGAVQEIHLAGHAVNRLDGGQEVLIDDHGDRVSEPVWTLYEDTLQRTGAIATLIEWDSRIPALDTLLAEAARADRIQEQVRVRVA